MRSRFRPRLVPGRPGSDADERRSSRIHATRREINLQRYDIQIIAFGLVGYPDIDARDRAALVAGRLLLAEGRIEREVAEAEVPITHLIVRRLLDLSALFDWLMRTPRRGDV
jgi:hypothetical protein